MGLTFFAPPPAEVALLFEPAEYFGLMVLALAVVVTLSGKSLTKGLISAGFGLLFTAIGMDSITGEQRMTFGTLARLDDIFALMKIGKLLPTLLELRDNLAAMFRATLLGFGLGMLPGVSPAVTAFIAYDTEKRFSKHPEKFGTGVLQGVTAPEGANNSATSGGFVPLFAFGLPSSAAMAMLLGALMIYGLQPGPIMWQHDPGFIWTVIALLEDAKTAKGGQLVKWGSGGVFSIHAKAGSLPVRNYTTNVFPEHEQMNAEYIRSHFEHRTKSCWACGVHTKYMKVTEGPYAGYEGEEPEYEGMAAWGPETGNTDPGAMVMLANVTDRLGMDTNEASWIVGWVMECYEKGLLARGDLDGLACDGGTSRRRRPCWRRSAGGTAWATSSPRA